MGPSTDRILTTHVGSLVRPPELLDALHARDRDPDGWERAVAGAVRDVVHRQRDAGIDVVDDGEYSKTGFTAYVTERLSGFELRPPPPGQGAMLNFGRDRKTFSEFYEEYDRPQPEAQPGGMTAVCVGPIAYRGMAVLERDFANLRAAMREAGVETAFIPAAAPGTIELQRINAYYPSEQDYLFAIADAMRTEYRAIVEAGFILQIDDPGLGETWDMMIPAPSMEEYRRFQATNIEALNGALESIPEDRVRYHLCWGSWQGPHIGDLGLKDIVDLLLTVKAGAYSIEAANPRHSWEWRIWEDVKLPEGKVLIPGVIAHTTAVVEHPETVAERIANFARVVGAERVIAGADCGFAQGALYERQHPTVMWAKFEALAEGAKLASQRLWRK